ncbi:MAG: pyroglutamyl-peptidase I family protein [Hyphomicrobium sp.]
MIGDASQRQADRLRRILLTGFGPFPSVPDNASARLVTALAPIAREQFPTFQILFDVLPTEWTAAPERLRALLVEYEPEIVLSFGVAKDAGGFRLETQGLNACRPSLDAIGLPPLGAAVRPGQPESHACSAPLDAIAARLRTHGYPVSLSDDAGGYLCNAVYFHALDHAAARGSPDTVVFVHIPTELDGGPLTIEWAVSGALEILTACVDARSVNA